MLKPNRRSIALVSACAPLFLASASLGQWWWPPTNGMTSIPGCPHPSVQVEILLSGTWPHSCIPNGSSAQVNGNTITVFVDRSPPPGFCLTVLTPWSRSAVVGPLPAGTYTVMAAYTEGGVIVLPAVQVGQFDVSPSCPGGCYPDCNQDGVLTIPDFGCFQTEFVQGNMYADCDANGVLTIADFGCFQTKFVAGCP